MFRLTLCMLLLALPARAGDLPTADPLIPSPAFTLVGPAVARGALVWLHGAHDSRTGPPPPEPPLIRRMANHALDVWRFDRPGGRDGLAAGAEGLARGLEALRRLGYQWIVVSGFSRGAWIALTAAQHKGLADAIVALSPAAHGTRAERWEQAMAEWTALWQSVETSATRVVLVQLAEDPYDRDPARRLSVVDAARARAGFSLLSLFKPDRPSGHTGSLDPEFDPLYGAEIAAFVDGDQLTSHRSGAEIALDPIVP